MVNTSAWRGGLFYPWLTRIIQSEVLSLGDLGQVLGKSTQYKKIRGQALAQVDSSPRRGGWGSHL